MLTQRQATLSILILQILGALVLLLSAISAQQAEWPIILVSTILYAVLAIAYWRGQTWVRFVNVVLLTLSTGFGIQEPLLSEQFSPAVLAVPVLILIIANWQWMLGSAVTLLTILIVRAEGGGPYTQSSNLIIIATTIIGLVIVRLITDTAQRQAEIAADEASAAARRAEQNADALAVANEQLNEQLGAQQRLLDLVTTLETPTVGISEDVLLAPLVGHLDSRRTAEVTQRLLTSVNEQRAKLLIIDITGVPVVDTDVAAALLRMVRTVSLLGCRVILTGVSASTAVAISRLGLDLSQIETVRDPREALSLFTRNWRENLLSSTG
jgi:rsbT co-antagonist protein RsbR